MKNIPLLLATVGGSLLLIIGVTFFFSQQQQQAAAVSQAQLMEGARHFYTKDQAEEATPSATPDDNPEATESASATNSAQQTPSQRIIVTEFSDFQCPACGASYQLKDQIYSQFAPEEVEFIYRHFPLTTIHDKSLLAAQAGEAAGQFGRFWQMHDKLFENQDTWSEMTQDEAKEAFTSYAEELAIDREEFTAMLENDTIRQAVQRDINVTQQLHLSSTPTFFVNDQKVPASEVISTIEQLRVQ